MSGMTIEDLNDEAELVVAVARLIRGIEGVKDWAARSGATGLEQWCAEALSPTGKLAVFPPAAPTGPDPKAAMIKALADALEETAPRKGPNLGPCWCTHVDFIPPRDDLHGVICVRWRAALRLAGRLSRATRTTGGVPPVRRCTGPR